MSQRRCEKSREYFYEGYNCCQSVVKAFSDLVPIHEATLLKIASAYGGGIGRMREVCGAVNGIFLVYSALYGYETPETGEIKAELYSKIQSIAGAFKKTNGSIICRELLNINETETNPVPTPRTPEFYKNRPCADIIYLCSEILEEYLGEENEHTEK